MKFTLTGLALMAALGLLLARQGRPEKSQAPTTARAASTPAIRFAPNAAAIAGASGDTFALSLSADGKRIASVGGAFNPASGFLSVIETQSKKELLSLQLSQQFGSVGLSPDGKFVAYTGRSGDLKVLEVDTGKLLFSKKLGSAAHLAFAPDGLSLATVTEAKTVQIWDIPSGEEQTKFLGATMPLRCVAFSPDGRKLAAGSGVPQKKGDSNGTIFVWNVVTHGLMQKLESDSLAPILSISFSRDGTRIAGASSVRQVRIWDLASAKIVLKVLPEPQVHGLAFSPDGETLAAAAGDGSVRILNTTSGEEVGSLTGLPGACRCVAYTEGGKKLISGGSASSLKLWDIAGKKEIATLQQSERMEDMPVPLAMAANSDGSLIALATEDKGVILREGKTGKVKTILKGHQDAVTCVAFSPDDRTLATGSADKTIKLWDVATGKDREILKGHTNWVYALAFSHDGKTLASGAYDKTVRLWDAKSGKELGTIEAHRGSVRAVAFSPDDKTIATGGSDRFVKLWTIAGRELKIASKSHEGSVRSLAFSSNGKLLASGGEDGKVKFWNAETGEELIAAKKEHEEEVTAVAFVGERTVISGGLDDEIRQWDAVTGEMFGTLPGHTGGVTGLALVSGGGELISAGADRSIKRFHQAAPDPILFKGHTGVVQYVAFSPDGKRFVSCGEWPEGDLTLRVWNVEKGTEILKIDHPGQAPMAMFSPNGKFIVSASEDSNAYLWDADTGKKIRTFRGHGDAVEGVAFNADGTQLLTGGRDTTARLWDTETGREIKKFTGHVEDMIRRVAFHPDGKHALTGGRDGFVRMWELDTAKEVRKFKSSSNWADSLAVTKDGKFLAIGGKIISVHEMSSGKLLSECIGHQFGLTHVAFSDNGKQILSAGYDGTARLWDRVKGKELYRFPGFGEMCWCAAFSPDGKWIVVSGGGGNKDGKWVKGNDHAVRLWKMPDERMLAEFAEQ
jgi:WD40 repeat protein